MCYITLFSTTSSSDLSRHNSALMSFSRSLPGIPEEKYLRHEFKWYLGSKSGCSCDFRHLHPASVSLGFGEPEDWFPEDPSALEATRQVCCIVRGLVEAGEEVECIDAWSHGQKEADELAGELEVSIGKIKDSEFRFFEAHRFAFSL